MIEEDERENAGGIIMAKMYEEWFAEYLARFGKIFPTRMAPIGEDEQIALMKKSLDENKPYDPYDDRDIDPDADY